MQLTITWMMFLRITNAYKIPQVIETVNERAACAITVTEAERYWKDPSLMRVMARTSLTTQDAAHAVYDILRLAQRIGHQWQITGPVEAIDGQCMLGGWTDNSSVPGVTHLEFYLAPAHPDANMRVLSA